MRQQRPRGRDRRRQCDADRRGHKEKALQDTPSYALLGKV